MKVALLDIKSRRKECINKDFMGGFGWAFNAGSSFPLKLINLIKKRGEKLPLLSFGYLAAIFAKNSHSVSCMTNTVPKADIVIISSSMVDYDYEIEWARRIKRTGCKVGFVGPFSGFLPEQFLNSCDFVIRGEPEQAAMNISLGREPRGIIESNPIEDLNSLPFPRWDNFPIKEYSYLPVLKEKPFLPILASRGCVYECNYCPYLVSYKYRTRSAENVFSEIKYLQERFKVKGLLFRDPLFGANKDFVFKLCELILKNNVKLRWACETRLNCINKQILEVMYKAGLRVLNTGIESADPDILKKASRIPVDIKHQEEMIRYCDKLGIRVTAFYILGLPDDTYESIINTLKYAQYLNTNVAQFFIHTPFPGTRYFEEVKDQIIEKDWRKFDCYTPVLRHKNLTTKQILKLKEKAFSSYYFRLGYFKKFISRACRDMVG